ncbi:hypothetical protein KSC_024020 [Ktedonobacter sp. SOSP1-52]|nr:hypothetical protein KSC_024020 [Ktedonobacter sp. SOSP1-52]
MSRKTITRQKAYDCRRVFAAKKFADCLPRHIPPATIAMTPDVLSLSAIKCVAKGVMMEIMICSRGLSAQRYSQTASQAIARPITMPPILTSINCVLAFSKEKEPVETAAIAKR